MSSESRWALRAPIIAAVATGLVCVLVFAVHEAKLVTVPGLNRLEHLTFDARYSLRGPIEPKGDIVIVGIDDETYRRASEVFMRRRGWAKLISAVSSYEPKAIAIDAFFRARELNLSLELVERVRKTINRLSGLPSPSPELGDAITVLRDIEAETRGDEELIAAIEKAGNVITGALLFTEGEPSTGEVPEPLSIAKARLDEGVVVAAPHDHRPQRASRAAGSFPEIARAAAGAGYANITPDDDGVVRYVQMVIEHGGRLYLPLGLAMARAQTGARVGYVVGERVLHVGDRKIPVDERAMANLEWLGGAGTFPIVSAADVLDGSTPREALAGKLVFIGFTDQARDKIVTPFTDAYDGVELHATLAHNVLHGRFLRDVSPWVTILILLLVTVLLAAMQMHRIRQRGAWIAGAAGLAAIFLILAIAHLAFTTAGLIFEIAAPLATTLLVSLVSTTTSIVTLGREKAHLRTAFSQYVQGSLVERILAEPEKLKLGGERRELTVIFSDIRGFSKFSETLDPEALSRLLNEYLTPMTDRVFEHGGMLDKYIGDAVMAVFGAPLPMDEALQTKRACATALAWIEALRELNENWAKRNIPPVAIGVGINTGPMAVGNMGSETRFDYTVLGDAVNLAARLEAITKEYRVGVVVGPRTFELAKDEYAFRELDSVRVKGRSGSSPIYELLGTAEAPRLWAEDLGLYERALEAYRNGDWDDAETLFKKFADKHPEDGPAEAMLDRIVNLRLEPPDLWDGVYDQKSK